MLHPGSLTPAPTWQLGTSTCKASHPLQVGKPKVNLILCPILNLLPFPHFHCSFMSKLSYTPGLKPVTFLYLSHPGRAPHQPHGPSPTPLHFHVGALESTPPTHSYQSNSFQLAFHPGTTSLKSLPWLPVNGCIKSRYMCLALKLHLHL